MSQKHACPGSNPGWGTRFLRGSECALAALLQLGCGKEPRRACSEPIGRAAGRCARPNDSPVAQRNQERAATNREAEGSIPSGGASHGAVIQKKECLLVEQDDAGSSPAGAALFPRGKRSLQSQRCAGRSDETASFRPIEPSDV